MEYITNSLEFSKNFKISHNHILEKISFFLEEETINEKKFERSEYTNERNRKYPIYKITLEGYVLLAISLTANTGRVSLLNEFKENFANLVSKKINFEEIKNCLSKKEIHIIEQKTYIIYDKHRKMYKIGRTGRISQRLEALKNVVPDLELINVCNNDLEILLHDCFKEKRIEGEWFRLEKEDIEDIERVFKIQYNSIGFNILFNDIKKITSENSAACNQLKKFKKLINFEDDIEEIKEFKKFIVEEYLIKKAKTLQECEKL